jgi:hypothetical protein
MGTDRNEIINISCPCEKGRITITYCRPDHEYAHEGQKFREDKIECVACIEKFAVVQQDSKLVLVSRADCEQLKSAKSLKDQEIEALERRVWKTLEKSSELDSVVNHLNEFNTASAAYRCLERMSVFRGMADFRRKFTKHNCTKEWVKRHFYLQALEKLFVHFLGAPGQTLDEYFKEDSILRNRPVPSPTPIGKTIMTLNL